MHAQNQRTKGINKNVVRFGQTWPWRDEADLNWHHCELAMLKYSLSPLCALIKLKNINCLVVF